MKKSIRNFMLFSAALNLVLAGTLGFFIIGSMKADRAERELKESTALADVENCRSMLASSAARFAEGNKADARLLLRTAQYAGSANERFCELCGVADYCFFSDNAMYTDEDYIAILGALDSLICDRPLSEVEIQLAEKMQTEYSCLNFAVKTYPHISSLGDMDVSKTRKIAADALGKSAVLSVCENSLFPVRHVFTGGNTCASVSAQGGKLIELFFYLGETELDINEEEALLSMKRIIRSEKLPEMNLKYILPSDGFYYAEFAVKRNEELSVKMVVSGRSGRVCYYDAERFYEGYRKQ